MAKRPNIIGVDRSNVEKTGFFCFMSKKKAPGYKAKLDWLKGRFDEGLCIKMFELPARGFVEYIPGEQAWRAVCAEGYMFIHCIWIVGKSKGQGLGSLLLSECERHARECSMKGVAMLTSGGHWLADNRLLLKDGYKSVGSAPPNFELLVKKFGQAPDPSLQDDWERRASAFGKGLTIAYTHQCPYINDAIDLFAKAAETARVRMRTVQFESFADLQKRAPYAYGSLGVVLNGRLLSYRYQKEKDAVKLIAED